MTTHTFERRYSIAITRHAVERVAKDVVLLTRHLLRRVGCDISRRLGIVTLHEITLGDDAHKVVARICRSVVDELLALGNHIVVVSLAILNLQEVEGSQVAICIVRGELLEATLRLVEFALDIVHV